MPENQINRRECLNQMGTAAALLAGSLAGCDGMTRMTTTATLNINPASPAQNTQSSAEDDPNPVDGHALHQDWPGFLGPQRNGTTTEAIGCRDWTQLPLLWQIPLGEGYAIGSCQGKHVFQTHRVGGQEILLCLDSVTGDSVWRKDRATDYLDMYGYDGGPRCSPILTQDYVLTYGVDGVLTCRSIKDGQEIWKRALNQAYGVKQNFFGVGSAPVIFKDQVLVMVGGSPETDQNIPPGALDRVTPDGSAMVSLDLATGEQNYQVGQDLASYSAPIVCQLTDDSGKEVAVALALCRAGLLAFDPRTGQQHFHFPFRAKSLESVNAATPVAVGNHVLISETYGLGGALLKLDPQNLSQPSIVWQDDPKDREQSLQAHWNTPVVHDGMVYASSGRHTANAELRCVELMTGKVKWSQASLTRCSITKAGKELIVVSEKGDLFLMQPNAGKFQLITTHQFAQPGLKLRYPAWSAAVVSHGKMLVRDKATLFCFDVMA